MMGTLSSLASAFSERELHDNAFCAKKYGSDDGKEKACQSVSVILLHNVCSGRGEDVKLRRAQKIRLGVRSAAGDKD